MRGDSVGDGSTLVGGTTLGGGDTVGVEDGCASAVVVFQLARRLRSLDISESYWWWTVVEEALTEQDRKFREWTILSSGVISGWVRYSWSTLMVSEMMIDLVVESTTWKQR